jgi:Fur family ferric uptake transcriptional regulator
MAHALTDVDSLRPAGSKRSSKRDSILNLFLQHEGHLSADDLYGLVSREDRQVSRATVYRALQWMVEAGIARKVDFGDGRFRYEHSYRHPRHFHLICQSCNRSAEFLSPDIESLIEEIAAARDFTAGQSVLQIYGTCGECRTGRAEVPDTVTNELLFARDALRIAIATERSGFDFYRRAARAAGDDRARGVFERLADDERQHLARVEQRYQRLLAEDPRLESRPTFLFFKGAANGLFATAADQVARGVSQDQALLTAIRCERASHRFFRRYGERFEDPEGQRLFLEFASEERAHLELLIRECRALGRRKRRGRATRAPRRARVQA